MSRILVVFFLQRRTANICTSAFFALAEIFFAFVVAGVAAVILSAHFSLMEVWMVDLEVLNLRWVE